MRLRRLLELTMRFLFSASRAANRREPLEYAVAEFVRYLLEAALGGITLISSALGSRSSDFLIRAFQAV